MSEQPKPNHDKTEDIEEKHQKPKKPPGYRKFEKLLKQAVKAPAMRRKG
jgi:hypothetical protein